VAPRQIPILRGELIEDIRAETAAAAAKDVSSALANLSRQMAKFSQNRPRT
jgi:sRNA-binding carbon storage regulator CsrA